MKMLKADLTELVFRGRNRRYGAYALRRGAPRALFTGLGYATALVTLAAFSPKAHHWLEGDVAEVHAVPVRGVIYLQPPPSSEETPPVPPLPRVQPPPRAATQRFTVPTVVPDDAQAVIEQMPDQDSLQASTALIGTSTQDGDPFAQGPGGGDGPGGPETGLGPPIEVEVIPGDTEFYPVEKEPVPVNMDQFRQAIGYPPVAREIGLQGTVVVRVLVTPQGHYQDHRILRSPHAVLSKAVVEQLPLLRFTPALQGDRAVYCWVNVPVRFALK